MIARWPAVSDLPGSKGGHGCAFAAARPSLPKRVASAEQDHIIATPRPLGTCPSASQMTWGAPPLSPVVMSLPPAKNPIIRLSGDQKKPVAPCVPASERHAGLSIGLTRSIERPSDWAATARYRPSGRSRNWAPASRTGMDQFCGATIGTSIAPADNAAARRYSQVVVTDTTPKAALMNQATRSLRRRSTGAVRMLGWLTGRSTSSISISASAMSWRRVFGSFRRQRSSSVRLERACQPAGRSSRARDRGCGAMCR